MICIKDAIFAIYIPYCSRPWLYVFISLQINLGLITVFFSEQIFEHFLNSVIETHLVPHLIGTFQQLVVAEGTRAFSAWARSPAPLTTQMYFFTVLNPEEILRNKAKPRLEEKGPYTFRY